MNSRAPPRSTNDGSFWSRILRLFRAFDEAMSGAASDDLNNRVEALETQVGSLTKARGARDHPGEPGDDGEAE